MKRILVIMTASPSSRQAVDDAVGLATNASARVCIVRVVASRAPSMAACEAWLDEIEKRIPPAMRDGAVALLGPAVEAIAGAASAYQPDAILCGARAHRALLRMDRSGELTQQLAPKVLVVPSEAPSAGPGRNRPRALTNGVVA